MDSKYTIEPMQDSDWAQVREIYWEGILTGNATFEHEAPNWEHWDKDHLPGGRFVARDGESVWGWAALSAYSSRCVYAGVAQVSIYVGQNSRGMGIGSALFKALIAESEALGIWTLQSGVFPENIASLSLHHRFGFREVGRRERIGQMNGVWRDVILLERRSSVIGI